MYAYMLFFQALYENMLVELPFAGFFLSKILGKMDSDFHQLASLDPLLYKYVPIQSATEL